MIIYILRSTIILNIAHLKSKKENKSSTTGRHVANLAKEILF